MQPVDTTVREPPIHRILAPGFGADGVRDKKEGREKGVRAQGKEEVGESKKKEEEGEGEWQRRRMKAVVTR